MPVEFAPAQHRTERMTIHFLWMTAALSCDGDSFSMTAATSPSLENLVQGIVPGMLRVLLHHPLLAFENGHEFMWAWFDAAAGKLDPFVLVVEGSIPTESLSGEGYWAGLGTDPDSGQPIPTSQWVDRLAARAAAVVAVGTCATYGGVPAMCNNPTGAMGLPDYLGWGWRSHRDVPIVCIPGCPAQPDNITETLLYLSLMLAGKAPPIQLDEALRPRWLFNRTVHENCDRAAFYEQGDFAEEFGSPKCMVKLGCKGPVVKCNVGVRGWVRGRGGCPNVGGICIGCTMPGFPDRFQPFMESAYPVRVSTNAARFSYGPVLRMMRRQGLRKGAREPAWRRPSPVLQSGYQPRWDAAAAEPDLEFETYELGEGRTARRCDLGSGAHVRVEVHADRLLVGWTCRISALEWIESIHDPIGVEPGTLGLVLLGKGIETRGDLTWRETRALLEAEGRRPRLVRADHGQFSHVYQRADEAGPGSPEVWVIAPTLDGSRLRRLILGSADEPVCIQVEEILKEVRLARLWSGRRAL